MFGVSEFERFLGISSIVAKIQYFLKITKFIVNCFSNYSRGLNKSIGLKNQPYKQKKKSF